MPPPWLAQCGVLPRAERGQPSDEHFLGFHGPLAIWGLLTAIYNENKYFTKKINALSLRGSLVLFGFFGSLRVLWFFGSLRVLWFSSGSLVLFGFFGSLRVLQGALSGRIAHRSYRLRIHRLRLGSVRLG